MGVSQISHTIKAARDKGQSISCGSITEVSIKTTQVSWTPSQRHLINWTNSIAQEDGFWELGSS